ncbi:MAG: hypothetical protein ACE5LU_00255 [Anaerolineae bacterium]
MEIANSVFEVIGNAPMLRLNKAEINVIDLEQEKELPDLSVHSGVIGTVQRQKCRDLESVSSDVWCARQFGNPENVTNIIIGRNRYDR